MPPPTPSRSHWRWLPFLAAAGVSIATTLQAPDGRKPFYFDASLHRESLLYSLNKAPHLGACAVLSLLALWAVGGPRHFLRAIALTVIVGACWEAAQTIAVGHTARLSDLAPDAVGAVIGCLWGSAVAWLYRAPPGHVPRTDP